MADTSQLYPDAFFSGFINFLKVPDKHSCIKLSERDILLRELFAERSEGSAGSVNDPLWGNVEMFFEELCKSKTYIYVFEFMVYIYAAFPQYTTDRGKFRENHPLLAINIERLENILRKYLGDKAEEVIVLLRKTAAESVGSCPALRNVRILQIEAGIVWECAGFTKEADIDTPFSADDAKELAEKAGKEYLAAALHGLFRHEVTRSEPDIGLCLDIAEKALGAFDGSLWTDRGNIGMKLLFADYMTFFRKLISELTVTGGLTALNYDFSLNADDKECSDRIFLAACMGDDFIFSDGIELFGQRKELARLLCSVTERAYAPMESYIRRDAGCDLRSWSIMVTMYILICVGEQELCGEYTVRNFPRLAASERQYIFIHIITVRCVLASRDIKQMDILYGYFCYEANLALTDKSRQLGLLRETAECLKLARLYIEQGDKESYELIYGSGRFIRAENELSDCVSRGMLIGYDLWRVILEAVNMLSCKELHIGGPYMSGDCRSDKDVWVRPSLPDKLRERFDNGLRPAVQEYMNVAQCLMLTDVKNEIDDIITERLNTMFSDSAKKYIDELEAIKKEYRIKNDIVEQLRISVDQLESGKNLLESENKSLKDEKETLEKEKAELEAEKERLKKYEDELNEFISSDANIEVMYKAGKSLSECISEMSRLTNIRLTSNVRADFLGYGQKFSKKYCGSVDLIGKIDAAARNTNTKNEVIDDNITSEMVYRFLKSVSDNRGNVIHDDGTVTKLDFSSALISMTKALECVINNCIYKRISGTNAGRSRIIDLRDYHYIKGRDVKDSIELGTCAYLFGNDYGRLGVNNYADISRLRSLAPCNTRGKPDIRLKRSNGTAQNEHFRADDDNFNGDLLKDALLYVSNRYRNPAAHPGQNITEAQFIECREIIVQARYLLWIILYILK